MESDIIEFLTSFEAAVGAIVGAVAMLIAAFRKRIGSAWKAFFSLLLVVPLVPLAACAGGLSGGLDQTTGTTLAERCAAYHATLADAKLAGEIVRMEGGEPPADASRAVRIAWTAAALKCVPAGEWPETAATDTVE